MPPKSPKKTNVRNSQSLSKIKPTEVALSKGISFSFRYFKHDNDKFSVRNREATYLQALLGRLRNLSTLTVQEVINNRSNSLRCHKIVWSDTTESGFGIPNEDQLIDLPYQFQISANEHGRIHGFFIESVFYIVWLDPDHNLYQ